MVYPRLFYSEPSWISGCHRANSEKLEIPSHLIRDFPKSNASRGEVKGWFFDFFFPDELEDSPDVKDTQKCTGLIRMLQDIPWSGKQLREYSQGDFAAWFASCGTFPVRTCMNFGYDIKQILWVKGESIEEPTRPMT